MHLSAICLLVIIGTNNRNKTAFMSVIADNERCAQPGVRDHFCRGEAVGIFPHHVVQSFPHERITCEFLQSIMTNIDYQ